MVVGASISSLENGATSTTNGAEIEWDNTINGAIRTDVGTTDGGPIDDSAGSREPDPPAYYEFFGTMHHRCY